MSKECSIVRIHVLSLRKEEIQTFNSRVLGILNETCGACGKPYADFKAAAELYERILHDKGFSASLSLEEYDRRADEAWRGLDMQIAASVRHPREEVRKAAEQVKAVWEKTPNPTQLNYDQEYGALTILLSQLNAIERSVLIIARVDEYVDYLGVCVNEFILASKRAMDVRANQQAGTLKDAAQNCYKTWQNLAKYIEAMANAEALPRADEAISKLSMMNTQIKRKLDIRKNDRELGKDIENDGDVFETDEAAK